MVITSVRNYPAITVPVSREFHQYCKVKTVTSMQRKLCLLAPGLDFAIRLGNSVLNLPDRQENFLGIQITLGIVTSCKN